MDAAPEERLGALALHGEGTGVGAGAIGQRHGITGRRGGDVGEPGVVRRPGGRGVSRRPGTVAACRRSAAGAPSRSPGLPDGLNQISEPSPEKPRLRSRFPGVSIGGRSSVRLSNCPVPSWLTQTSSCPARSARKATNRPSGEISACSSVPGQFVTRENVALASGFSAGRAGPRRRAPARHDATPPRAPTSATHGSHGSHAPGASAGIVGRRRRQHVVHRVDLDPDVADVAQPLPADPSRGSGAAAVESAPGVVGGQRRPVRLALEDLRDRVRDRLAARTPRVRSASRRARTRTPRCRCACRPAARAPARDSCTRPCR